MLVFIMTVLARLLDPLAWAICAISGAISTKPWIAVSAGAAAYGALMLLFGASVYALASALIAGALMGLAAHGIRLWIVRRKASSAA